MPRVITYNTATVDEETLAASRERPGQFMHHQPEVGYGPCMPKRPAHEADETADVVHKIGQVLSGRSGEQVAEILGILLLSGAAQGAINVEAVCAKVLELLPGYKAELEEERLDS